MNEVTVLFLVSATYLLLGAWVIRQTAGSSKGVPVKVRRELDPRSDFGRRFDRDLN